MKKRLSKMAFHAGKILAAVAFAFVAFNVNTCCALYAHQPELPKTAKKLKKF